MVIMQGRRVYHRTRVLAPQEWCPANLGIEYLVSDKSVGGTYLRHNYTFHGRWW